MKPLTAEDLVIGGKYVPHSKSIGDPIAKSICIKNAKKRNQPYLFYNGYIDGVHLFAESYDKCDITGDYFLPSDVTPYTEPNQTPMDYTEQPFNLQTALKHPEWVRTRDGREIDFIKEYPQKDSRWDIIAVTNCGVTVAVSKDGLQLNEANHRKHDLILRVPYQTIFVRILKNGKAYWSKEDPKIEMKDTDEQFIACIPVKIPAND